MKKVRIQERKAQAQQRQELRGKRTPQEQITVLDNKLGKEIGAVKERKRLTR